MRTSSTAIVLALAVACSGSPGPSDQAAPATGDATTTTARNEAGQGKASPARRGPDAAPDFTITTFEGDRFRLSEQVGTPVVLTFWESW